MTKYDQPMSDLDTEAVAQDTVQAFFDRFADGWKTNDGAALANCFVEAGTLINPFGQRADGQNAIAAMYSEYFGGMLRDTSTTITLATVRLVETDHAFADGEQTILSATGEVVLVAHMAALLRRDGGSWLFVDARPYTVPTAPA
ncbi:MAG: hypothetical protein QOG64_2132 [Acidimicrobiaceae bacterium]|jgi:uncharacterized protein (TIGR02246 family)|nr:hypothetical protein [Acidimicrobiaceae bacterium]